MRANAALGRTSAATKEALSSSVSTYLYADYSFKTNTENAI